MDAGSHPRQLGARTHLRCSSAGSGSAATADSQTQAFWALPYGCQRERGRNGRAATSPRKPTIKLRAAYGSELTGTKSGRNYNEAISVRLEEIEGRWWCGFDPYTAVEVPRDERAVPLDAAAESDPLAWSSQRRPDPTADWRRERWATKYNSAWANIIDAWANLLTSPRGITFQAFGIEAQEGVDAAFRISPLTGFSRPGHHDKYFDRRQ